MSITRALALIAPLYGLCAIGVGVWLNRATRHVAGEPEAPLYVPAEWSQVPNTVPAEWSEQ